jgi:hypothetical protein
MGWLRPLSPRPIRAKVGAGLCSLSTHGHPAQRWGSRPFRSCGGNYRRGLLTLTGALEFAVDSPGRHHFCCWAHVGPSKLPRVRRYASACRCGEPRNRWPGTDVPEPARRRGDVGVHSTITAGRAWRSANAEQGESEAGQRSRRGNRPPGVPLHPAPLEPHTSFSEFQGPRSEDHIAELPVEW